VPSSHTTHRCNNTPSKKRSRLVTTPVSHIQSTDSINHGHHSPYPQHQRPPPSPAAAATFLVVHAKRPYAVPSSHTTHRCNNTPSKKKSRLVITPVSHIQSTDSINHGHHSPYPQHQRPPPSPAAAATFLVVHAKKPHAEPSTHSTPRCNNTPSKKRSRLVTTTVPHIHSTDSAHLILSVDVCSLLQQQPQHLWLSMQRCRMQSRPPILLPDATITPGRRATG
jgi:hypothetical protein